MVNRGEKFGSAVDGAVDVEGGLGVDAEGPDFCSCCCCLCWTWTCVRVANHSSEGCSNTKIGYRWYFIPLNGWGGKYGTTVSPLPS